MLVKYQGQPCKIPQDISHSVQSDPTLLSSNVEYKWPEGCQCPHFSMQLDLGDSCPFSFAYSPQIPLRDLSNHSSSGSSSSQLETISSGFPLSTAMLSDG